MQENSHSNNYCTQTQTTYKTIAIMPDTSKILIRKNEMEV